MSAAAPPVTPPAAPPAAAGPTAADAKTRTSLRAVWPMIRTLIEPRRGMLGLGFVLMAVNRVTGLVLPASTKWLIDDVIGKRKVELLLPLVAIVVSATLVQGATSFTLTQLLSKEAQRLIAEMRRNVQAHISRLPVSFYCPSRSTTPTARALWSRAS